MRLTKEIKPSKNNSPTRASIRNFSLRIGMSCIFTAFYSPLAIMIV